ncbi:MAG: hypothetical protein JWN67_4993 [Actinomycetia bacterium]|nr:hypothetical protein [Actinomycetes bacterium]
MADVPAGLVLVPRRIEGVTKQVWDITHRASMVPVVKDCLTRNDAVVVSQSLGGVDWERDADAIKVDPLAKAVYLAVQAEVWAEEHRQGRK